MGDPQTVIIALDASEQAETAVTWYIDHIHRPGNKVVLVHCIELPELKLNQARNMHMSPGVLASMWKDEEQVTKMLEEKMKNILKEKQIAGVLRTATGRPGEGLCRVAEEENADMIVTGTRGMGKVRRTILGSTSDFLVHHAHCPVVVCRSGSKSRHASGDSGGKKSRHASGDQQGKKSRHSSGDSALSMAGLRARLASLGKSRSQSVGSDTSDAKGEDGLREDVTDDEAIAPLEEKESPPSN